MCKKAGEAAAVTTAYLLHVPTIVGLLPVLSTARLLLRRWLLQ